VHDPKVAEMLAPKTFGFGTRRVPLESGYYEIYNQPNVTLVDLNTTPIERITANSIKTNAEEFGLDVIVYATGFDAVTGSFDRIAIEGEGGVRLKEKWRAGPATFLGVHTSGFPNFFMPGGPLASVGNFTPALEYSVDWIMDLMAFMDDRGFSLVDCKPEAEVAWTDFVRGQQDKLLLRNVRSWTTGINTNVEGKNEPRVIMYVGSAQTYRERCDAEKRAGYPDFDFERAGSSVAGMTQAAAD
jgi:cation diffusion facilitator CzcD-associated flavoprotein CzcO